MIGVIDLGNSSIKAGLFKKHELLQSWQFPTAELSPQSRLPFQFENTERILACSVVPRREKVLNDFYPQMEWVQPNQVPIKILLDRPEQLGMDRLMVSYGAWKKYRSDCMVIDFGTAITLDLVTAHAEYLGGIIIPGLEMSAWALHERTALLPEIKIEEPKALIGKDTASAILSGTVWGTRSMITGLVQKISEQTQKEWTLIATGSSAEWICKSIALPFAEINAQFLLESLQSLAE